MPTRNQAETPDQCQSFFTEAQTKELVGAIRAAEMLTSGEIRIHFESSCDDAAERVKHVFAELGMDRTEERNGVLFYLAIDSKLFAVLGDEGISELVDTDFWNRIRDSVLERFRQGDFVAGLVDGVHTAGESLAKYFPRKTDDANELSDDISFG